MTDREQATYDLIVRNSEQGYITTQREIYENYPYDPEERKDGYRWNDNPKVHDHCSMVWQDINRINQEQGKKPIIYGDYVYVVPHNFKELAMFVKKAYWDKAMTSLKRCGNLLRKGKADGTFNLFDADEEGDMKEYEAFVKSVFETN